MDVFGYLPTRIPPMHRPLAFSGGLRWSFLDTPAGGCFAPVACKPAPSSKLWGETLRVDVFPFNNHSQIFLLLLSAVRLWATLFALSTNRRRLTTGSYPKGYIKGWGTIFASLRGTIFAGITRKSIEIQDISQGYNFRRDNFEKSQGFSPRGTIFAVSLRVTIFAGIAV